MKGSPCFFKDLDLGKYQSGLPPACSHPVSLMHTAYASGQAGSREQPNRNVPPEWMSASAEQWSGPHDAMHSSRRYPSPDFSDEITHCHIQLGPSKCEQRTIKWS